MTIAHRIVVFLDTPSEDATDSARPVLDQLAESLQQSCQLVVRQEDSFRIRLQSVPSAAFYVNMPIGMVYQVQKDADDISDHSYKVDQQPNPNLPDITDVYAPIFQGTRQVAFLVSSCVKRRNAPSLEDCRAQVAAAAHRLSASFITQALVA
jgi:DNA-binding IclR family transcriptional regulator